MIWVAMAIVLAALIAADKPRSRGGYQPRKSDRPMPDPPSGGSSAHHDKRFRDAERALIGERWTDEQAETLHRLIDQGRRS